MDKIVLPYGFSHERGGTMCIECGMRTKEWLDWTDNAGVVRCPACGICWTWAEEGIGRNYKQKDGWHKHRAPFDCMEVCGDLGWRGLLRKLKP